jgi:F-type H+-transporting ATPase subunit a
MQALMRSLVTMLAACALALCLAAPAAAQDHPHAPQKSTMQHENSEFFTSLFSHLIPHAVFTPELAKDPEANRWFTFYDVNAFQVGVVLLLFVLFGAVLASFRTARPPWLIRVFRGWVRWIRDEMVYRVMGREDGARFVPYFVYLFFFLSFLNLAGLIPGSKTATATVYVTGALALVTLAMMVGGGMRKQGPGAYWLNLLPHGMPKALVPLMAFVELVSVFTKPFALMIRLFANMLGGHLVLYSFVGMIFMFAKMMEMGWLSWPIALPVTAMAVFITVLEGFVALLQAYIFTYLSVIFVQQALHPEH